MTQSDAHRVTLPTAAHDAHGGQLQRRISALRAGPHGDDQGDTVADAAATG